jgi:hypothetical protein
MRPPGDPSWLAAAARRQEAAADELERLGRQATAVAHGLVAGGGWDGPASRAYLARDGMLEANVWLAANALRVAGEGLTRLSAGLASAQATWDRARALAASSGLALDATGSSGRLALSLPPTDPSRVAVAARVSELLHEAAEQAGAADRAAMTRLVEATRMASLIRPDGVPAAGAAATSLVGTGAGAVDPARRDEGGGSPLGWALDFADRVGVALGAGLAAIEARAQALLRLVRSGQEPAAALAAVRALAAFERSTLNPTLAGLLPLAGPPVTLAANLADHEHGGEPVLRAVVRSLGESLGADAGQRLGIAMCGVDVGATATAGAVLCPAITVLTTSAGATLGGAGAVRIYDALAPEPPKTPAPAPGPGPVPTPRPAPEQARGPEPEHAPAQGPGPGPAAEPGPARDASVGTSGEGSRR